MRIRGMAPPCAPVPTPLIAQAPWWKAIAWTGNTTSLPPSLRRWHLNAYLFACEKSRRGTKLHHGKCRRTPPPRLSAFQRQETRPGTRRCTRTQRQHPGPHLALW